MMIDYGRGYRNIVKCIRELWPPGIKLCSFATTKSFTRSSHPVNAYRNKTGVNIMSEEKTLEKKVEILEQCVCCLASGNYADLKIHMDTLQEVNQGEAEDNQEEEKTD